MSEAKYLQAADEVGARLCRDAIWSDGRCNWLGDSMEFIESRWQVAHRSFGPEMYNGTVGIALFLARLFSCTQEKIFRKTAEAALKCSLSQVERLDPAISFGFYSGLTGIAYVLAEAGEIFGEERLIQKGMQLLDDLSKHAPGSAQSWDIVSGSAGVAPVLLKLYLRYGNENFLKSALQHGDLVLQAAHRADEGWSWKTIQDATTRNLTGFSHGTAGIAWSLLELYHHTKEQRFLVGAQEALRYERRWFDPQQGNWPDFRSLTQTGTPAYALAWCHGAPGIGLARLRSWQILNSRECLEEAQIALRTTMSALNAAMVSAQGNYSLCHGNCGNAELLILAAEILEDTASLRAVEQLADNAIENYLVGRNLWPCGILNGAETPNLMLGLAGIGYFYLRLYDRKRTSSVLLVGPQ